MSDVPREIRVWSAISFGPRLALGATVVALFTLALVLLVVAPTTASAADGDRVLSSPADEGRTDPGPLWTEQRMRRAPALDGESSDPGIDRRRARRLGRGAGASGQFLAAGATPFATVGPDRDVGDYLSYPERAHGRIFGTIPGAGDYTCSGTLVSSSGGNLVYTAGHCLYDKDTAQYATNVIFVPAYKQGDAPYDAYAATQLYALDGWIQFGFPEAYSYDVAAMTLDLPLEQLIGARGITVDLDPEGRSFDIFGYPARPNPPYDGERPIHCPKADFQGYETELYPVANPSVIAGPCYMQQGSSGGGWVVGGGYVNSVVSHGFCDSEPALCGLIHGPYFSDGAVALYQAGGGGNGQPSDSLACAPVQADVERAKRAEKQAKKQLKKAKKQLKKAKKKGKKSKVKKAKKKVKKAKKKVKKAGKDKQRAEQASQQALCS